MDVGSFRFWKLVLLFSFVSAARAQVCYESAPSGTCAPAGRQVRIICDTQQVCTCEAGTWTCTVPGATSPGGSDQQVQYNDAGVFGGESGLTYNETTDETKAKILNAVRYASMYATGGTGTSGDPWVGWTGAVAARTTTHLS